MAFTYDGPRYTIVGDKAPYTVYGHTVSRYRVYDRETKTYEPLSYNNIASVKARIRALNKPKNGSK